MVIKGIPASHGFVVARVYKMEEPELIITRVESDPELETEKFENAIVQTEKELERLKERTLVKLDEEHAAIFDAHLLVLRDPELKRGVESKIKEGMNASYAVKEVADQFIMIFSSMDNEYMRERAADIKDVTTRLLQNILGIKKNDLSLLDEEVVVIAHDLTPSDTALLDKKYAKGFATEIGGRTSHSAIMARSLEISAVVGVTGLMDTVNDGDLVILDGEAGQLIINPSDEEIVVYNQKEKALQLEKERWSKLKNEATISRDGHSVELAANIGSPQDLDAVLENGAEGIGLFRTEFLYMGKQDFPTEEEQFLVYKEVLERMEGKPVVVRTLDIGGDKELCYMEMPNEMNPFLGYRAIRLCLDQTTIFRTQLRALLRASVFGNLKIMFPMIATVDEFKQSKAILEDVKGELIGEGISVGDIEVGMMVEVPSAAILADQFARYADFFSIGTNDLIQYTFAADRMNENVSYLYQPYHPSLLRLVKMVIDAAHKEGKWAGMCGEVAGDQKAIPILLGLGLDEFSMSATSILESRFQISDLDKKEMETLAKEVILLESNEEVLEYVKKFLEEK